MNNVYISPTRMELSRLKKKLMVARRGHKLLKDKRDEMTRRFIDFLNQYKLLKKEVAKDFKQLTHNFIIASACQTPELTYSVLEFSNIKSGIEIKQINIMGVKVPEYKLNVDKLDNNLFYGFYGTSQHLDVSILKIQQLLPSLIKLAEIEKRITLLACDIEKTRRRVNALEYNLIPKFTQKIRYITIKISENERNNLIRILKLN